MNLFKNFWNFLNKKQKNFFFVLVLFSILQTILEMIGIAAAIPFVTFLLKPESLSEFGFITNLINLDQIIMTDQLIIIFCVAFFSIFLIKNLIIVITNKLTYNFIFSFRTNLFKNLINKILHQDYIFFVKKGISQIFNTTLNEVNMYSLNIVKSLIILFSEILISFGILLLIILTGNIKGLILIFPIIIIVSIILKKINQSIKSWSVTRIEQNEKIINYNLNLINGIKEILIFGKANELVNKFDNSLKSLKDVDIKHNVVTAYPKVLLEQAVILIFILIILILNYLGTPNDNIIIILSFYLIAAYRLVPSINKIFVSYQSIKYGKPSIPKVMEYYNLSINNKYLKNEKNLEPLKFEKNIELKNIYFDYDNNIEIIKNFNFKINRNEIIGILGESGVGKSTLINLLTNLLLAKSGQIIVDGKEVNDPSDFRKYKNLFSISTQDAYLADGTVKDNIIFGSNDKYSKDRVNEAIKFACLDKTIGNLPMGIETSVGSSIKQLSSGQKQRISIARSFYSDRKVLIFDEATNALDEENEKFIFQNLKNLKKNKTIIIISHNPNNLEICDRIYKIENKNLVEI